MEEWMKAKSGILWTKCFLVVKIQFVQDQEKISHYKDSLILEIIVDIARYTLT